MNDLNPKNPRKIITRFSLAPFSQIHTIFLETPAWVGFYGAMLMAIFADGRTTFTAMDLNEQISLDYQTVSGTKILDPHRKETIKCVKLISHTLYVGKENPSTRKCIIDKYSINPDDYSLTHRLTILISQLHSIDDMFISNDFFFMVCRADQSFMVCFEEEVFKPVGLLRNK